MDSGKKIIVPWDFTEVAQNALAHAAKIAKVLENDIIILHIVKEEKDIAAISPKLNEVAANAEKTYD